MVEQSIFSTKMSNKKPIPYPEFDEDDYKVTMTKFWRAVLVGDIVNSRQENPEIYLNELKTVLHQYAKYKNDYQIYRGDSFQIRVEPEKAFICACHLKAAIKKHKKLDIKISIGIGYEEVYSNRVAESSGSAYLYSGDRFDMIGKNLLVIQSSDAVYNQTMNLIFGLFMHIANNWQPAMAYIISERLKHPNKTLRELSPIVKKSHSTISTALKRGSFKELQKVNKYYIQKTKEICQ